jgi:hypothetical protein
MVAQERATTAALLAHLAEVDARKLYLPAGFPSMYIYCVEELRLSEDSALKRIRAARAARRFPAIFDALADGRLHLSGVVLLTPHLNPANAAELLAAAAGKRKTEIEALLAQRFPRSELLPLVEVLPDSAPLPIRELAPGPVETPAPERNGAVNAPATPVSVAAPDPRSRVKPHAPQRFALHLVIDQHTHDRLRYAQQLLGHQIPSGDVAQVIGRALDVLIGQLEKRKFAATTRPHRSRRERGDADSPDRATDPRSIPARVRRAVWERDGGRCAFVSGTGQRCPAREPLEFDHVEPVARGAPRRWRTCACGAERTTSTRRSASSGHDS